MTPIRGKASIRTPLEADDIITIISPNGVKRVIRHFEGSLTVEGRLTSKYGGMYYDLVDALKEER